MAENDKTPENKPASPARYIRIGLLIAIGVVVFLPSVVEMPAGYVRAVDIGLTGLILLITLALAGIGSYVVVAGLLGRIRHNNLFASKGLVKLVIALVLTGFFWWAVVAIGRHLQGLL